MIPFLSFSSKCRRYRKPIQAALKRVLDRGWFILGPELESFEGAFGQYLGGSHVVGVNSGTDALFLALKALGVGPGHEVITVANTATPTVSAIRMTGARPVFVDVLPNSQIIDPKLISGAITPKTRAVVPVHLYGYPADMRTILRIAKRHNLVVVEDACQAHGAKFEGQMVGTMGDAGCFSFYPTKNLGALGDAGAVATKNISLAERIRSLRNYGEVTKYVNEIEGINSRLDELQAAILNWGLECLDEWNQCRAQLAAEYLRQLSNVPVELPVNSDAAKARVWHLFVIKVDRRDELRKALRDQGIETAIHYPMPIYRQHAYRFLRCKSSDLPVTTRLAERILSLPLYPEMAPADISKVCRAIKQFYK